MTELSLEDLDALQPGTRVLRPTQDRDYRWIKQPDGEWGLDGKRVWLTSEEMLASPPVRYEMPQN